MRSETSTGRTQTRGETATAEGAKRRNRAVFTELFGDVKAESFSAEEIVNQSEREWVQNIETVGPPIGFRMSGWKEWSATYMAKNFAMLERALDALNLNPGQRAMMLGYLLDQNYDLRTGHADLKQVRITPREDEGRCNIECTYDRYRDVRVEKGSPTQDQTVTLALGKEDFDRAREGGYEIPGLETDPLDQSALATHLLSRQRGISGRDIPNAYLSYEPEKGIAVLHAAITKRDRDGHVSSYGAVPEAVLPLSAIFSEDEQAILNDGVKGRKLGQAMDEVLAEKALGWSVTEYVNLSNEGAQERAVTSVRDRVADIANTALAEQAVHAVREKISECSSGGVREWRESAFQEAMRIWDAQQETQQRSLRGIGTRLLGLSTKPDRDAVRRDLWQQICALRPNLTRQGVLEEIRVFQKQNETSPSRVDVAMTIAIQADPTRVDLKAIGTDQHIVFTSGSMYRRQTEWARGKDNAE